MKMSDQSLFKRDSSHLDSAQFHMRSIFIYQQLSGRPIEPAQNTQNWTLLEEVWLRVFTHLEPVDLLQAAQVCHLWSQLINHSETLWKAKCLSVNDSQTKRQIMADKSMANRRWKEVYKDNYGHQFIKRQWLQGKISHVTNLGELPAKAFCPMDVNTWGEIFEHQLTK